MAMAQYTHLRKGRVEQIALHTRRVGDQKREKGVVEEWLMYLSVRVVGLWRCAWGAGGRDGCMGMMFGRRSGE